MLQHASTVEIKSPITTFGFELSSFDYFCWYALRRL